MDREIEEGESRFELIRTIAHGRAHGKADGTIVLLASALCQMADLTDAQRESVREHCAGIVRRQGRPIEGRSPELG